MDFVILSVIGIMIFAALLYIVKEKRSGAKCIGCESSKQCGCSHCDKKQK